MPVVSTLTFEGQTPGSAPVVSGDWTLVGSGSSTINAAAGVHGTRGVRWPTMDSYQALQYSGSAISSSPVVVDVYVIIRSLSTTVVIGDVLSAVSGGTNVAQIRVLSDRTIQLRSGTTATATSTATLAIGNTYRLSWRLTASGQELRMYAGEAASPIETLSGGVAGATRGAVRIGAAVSGTAAIDFDTIRVADTWLAPYATAPSTLAHYYVAANRELRPFRRTSPVTANPSESHYSFWIGHYDRQVRSGYTSDDAGFDQALSDSIGQSRPIGSFIHGYSGSNFPSTFQASSVSGAPALGLGAMLNVKRSDWSGLANGDYDSTIQSFFNSWPVETFGSFTINHEPENDGPSPATPSNPSYVSWASTNGPIWCQGIARTIAVAAPIIRARGLDVKLGGCLMDFSWDTTRWQYWDWWEYVDPQYLDVVEFQIDAYTKTVDGNPPHHHDLLPRLVEVMSHGRDAGIEHFSLFETACDRRERNNGDNLVGTDESVAKFWEEYFPALQAQLPETRMVGYFSIPTGPASAEAAIRGRGLEVFATACMNGKRP